jgi:Fe-S-cluster containining protein
MGTVCRAGCGACCIAPSISTPIPGMPHGKPAGMRCIQLTADNRCAIFGRPERPKVCSSLHAEAQMCGTNSTHAMDYLTWLETVSAPAPDRR